MGETAASPAGASWSIAEMVIRVSLSSAPGGISTDAPVGLFTTAPAVPTVAVSASTVTVAVALAVALALFVTCRMYSVVELGETLMGTPEVALIAPGCTVPLPPVNTGRSCALAPTRMGVPGEAVKLVMFGPEGVGDGPGAGLPPPPPQA
ncbi:MAG: hypothetical protein ACJ79M_04335, partial [Myxococcales bacterium]